VVPPDQRLWEPPVVTGPRRNERFVRGVAVDGDVAAAASVIRAHGWQHEGEALARAIGTAALLSCGLRQTPDQFADLAAGALIEAGVSETSGRFAFSRALMPDLDEGAEIRVALAQWRYLRISSHSGRRRQQEGSPDSGVSSGHGSAPGAQVLSVSSRENVPAWARRRLPPSSTPAFPGCLLSPSEMQTIRQMARGLSYAEAARETRRCTSTIRKHLHNAYGRLGVSSIVQALAVCTQAGWLDPVPDDGAPVQLADSRVSWAQRLYLEAFDQSLRAGDDQAEQERTCRLRDAALTGMYKDAGKDRPPWRAVPNEPIDRIIRTLQASTLGPIRPRLLNGHPAAPRQVA
jgi:DNA-binding CsgD family transcriptional regulator